MRWKDRDVWQKKGNNLYFFCVYWIFWLVYFSVWDCNMYILSEFYFLYFIILDQYFIILKTAYSCSMFTPFKCYQGLLRGKKRRKHVAHCCCSAGTPKIIPDSAAVSHWQHSNATRIIHSRVLSREHRAELEFLRGIAAIDPFNVCKHRKPRLGARAAWGQKNGAANRPAYCVKEKQTSLIDR